MTYGRLQLGIVQASDFNHLPEVYRAEGGFPAKTESSISDDAPDQHQIRNQNELLVMAAVEMRIRAPHRRFAQCFFNVLSPTV